MDLSLERRKDDWQFTSSVLSSDRCSRSARSLRALLYLALDKTYPTAGSLRVFKQFLWLEAGSVKAALSRPAHQRVTQAVGWLFKNFDLVRWSRKDWREWIR